MVEQGKGFKASNQQKQRAGLLLNILQGQPLEGPFETLTQPLFAGNAFQQVTNQDYAKLEEFLISLVKEENIRTLASFNSLSEQTRLAVGTFIFGQTLGEVLAKGLPAPITKENRSKFLSLATVGSFSEHGPPDIGLNRNN